MSKLLAHLRRIHSRSLEILADEAQNCASLSAVYEQSIGAIHPATGREIHAQSVLFSGLRASGYFTFAGAVYEMTSDNSRQIDLAIWLADIRRWFYLEVKPCDQQRGDGKVIEDAKKLKKDNPTDPRDKLRGVLAFAFKYPTKGKDGLEKKYHGISDKLKQYHFTPIGIGRKELTSDRYAFVQVGLWVTGLEGN